MGGSYNKNGRRKDPKKKKVLMGNYIAKDQWEEQETDGRMLFRRVHYRC